MHRVLQRARLASTVLLIVSLLVSARGNAVAAADGPRLLDVLAVDRVAESADLAPAADLLSVSLHEEPGGGICWLRVAFLALDPATTSLAALPAPAEVPLLVEARRRSRGGDPLVLASTRLVRGDAGHRPARDKDGAAAVLHRPGDRDAVWVPVAAELVAGAGPDDPLRFTVTTASGETVQATYPAAKAYEAHCALVLHGNQGLGYSDVFAGRWDDPEGSGFDEAMQIHQGTGVPGNFHLAGTLQSSAEWAASNGDPLDFNAWLATGVTAGWAGMITSAYAQHIMPFVRDEMNDWAVNVETQMIGTRYGYVPTVAWIPERVWLDTSGYPSAGVSDWIGDDFQPHGVQGVILDDDVHLAGHDNHQIHFLSANGLRLVPRDRTFTGNIVGGNGQGSLDILTGLAGSGVGEYRIAVFAEDWEAVAEMGIWATVTPNAKETYDWFVQKCADESAWLHTWKLADALANPNFNGSSLSPTPGTYWEIGGTDGYGGGDNGWYTHWAGWIPWANGGDGDGNCRGDGIGNCKNYGTLWYEAYLALMAAPDNDISQAGWYVLMTNLHETGWHDAMGGPISGWQHRYSAHMKTAMIYAEAAHWANGEYAATTAAYFQDIDNDGYSEVIVHNDRLFAVFRGAGGRLTNLFVKGPGYDDTAIGIDNAYWSDTNADYNDANHVGAFSEVSPDYQHSLYDMSVTSGAGPTVQLVMTHQEVAKTVTLTEGDSFLDVVYRVGPAQHWIQSGFSPSLVDLVWNARMDRIWASDIAYMGQRNPNTGICAAWVLGTGGAGHQRDFTATLMKGDEITASGTFQLKLFAGPTSAPDGTGEVAELRALATLTTDTVGPWPVAAEYYPHQDRLRVTFDQETDPATAVVGAFALDEDGDGAPEVALGAGTTISETGLSYVLTFQCDAATAAAIEALDPADVLLLVAADAVEDDSGNGNAAVDESAGVAVPYVATQVTIDGRFEPGEWDLAKVLPDSNDSAWTAANEIDALYVSWDDTYLYVGLDGIVSSNSWLIYLDVDPESGNGETDLSAIDIWERGAVFSAPGFAADFEYGCYQHQSVWDGDGFWEILSPTTTLDRSGEIVSAFDSQHLYGDAGGSELAIPWNTLYGLGNGAVPVGARLSLVASLCWDPEPDGVLGGDSAPSNAAAALPEVDAVWTVTVDGNDDGVPDDLSLSAVPDRGRAAALLHAPVPNPFNPRTTLSFEVPGPGAAAVELVIYDLQGRCVATLVRDDLPAGTHRVVWNGTDETGRRVAAGTYIACLRCRGGLSARPLSLIK